MNTKAEILAEMEASDERFRKILDTAQERWGKEEGLRYLYFYLAKGAELNSPKVLDWLEESIKN